MTMDMQTAFTPVLIALIPVLVNFIKKAVPDSMTWLVPLIAAVLGPVADLISQKALGVGVGPVAAVALGLAGIGLREVVNQLKKAGAPTNAPPATP